MNYKIAIFLLACGFFGDFDAQETSLAGMDELTTDMIVSGAPRNNASFFVTAAEPIRGESQSNRTVKKAPRPDCKLVNFAFETILIGTMIVLGLFGNSISFVVLWQQAKTSASMLILAALSVSDSILLMCLIFTKTIRSFAIYTKLIPDYVAYYSYVNVYVWPLVSMAALSTTYMTVLTAIHRYVAVCRPFQASSFCNLRKVKIQTVSVFLFVIAYNIPRFFEKRILAVFSDDGTFVKTVYELNELGSNSYYVWIHRIIVYHTLGFVIPLPILFWTTIRLCHVLKKAREMRLKMSNNKASPQSDDITPSLLFIILVYFIYQLCVITRIIYSSVNPNASRCASTYHNIQMANLFFQVFNSSINFVIYMVMSKSFRNTLQGMIGRFRSGDPTSSTSKMTSTTLTERGEVKEKGTARPSEQHM